MKITKKETGISTLKLVINVEESDYIKSVESRLLDYRKKITMPGFRVGKVPLTLVKKKYEVAIKVEEINKLLSSSIQQYISDNKIPILGNPMPSDKETDFLNNQSYTFEYDIGVQPKVTLSKAEKLKINYWVINPEKKEIDDHVVSLQKRFGNITKSNSIQKGDMLNILLEELDDQNNLKKDGVVSQTSILVDKIHDKSIQMKFLKMKQSEKINFELKKAFVNEADLCSMLKISKEESKEISDYFSCEIQEVSRLMPAKINSDFFKKVYPDKKIKNEKELRSIVEHEISERYLKESDRKFFNDCSLLFVDKIKLDLPKDFLKKWLKSNIKKEFKESDFEKEYNNYLKYISWQLIENQICEENSIKVSNEQLQSFTKSNVLQQMKNYGSVNIGDKEIDGIVANILKNEKEVEKMTNEIIVNQITAYFKSKMKLSKKTITLNEFIKLANNQN